MLIGRGAYIAPRVTMPNFDDYAACCECGMIAQLDNGIAQLKASREELDQARSDVESSLDDLRELAEAMERLCGGGDER